MKYNVRIRAGAAETEIEEVVEADSVEVRDGFIRFWKGTELLTALIPTDRLIYFVQVVEESSKTVE